MDDRDNLRVPLGQLNVGNSNNATESTMMAGSTSTSKTMNMDIRLRDPKIFSVRWIDGVTVTGYVDMHIAYILRNYVTQPKKTKKICSGNSTPELSYDQYAMCSVYLQIGKLLGVRPRNGKDSMFKEMYRNWALRRHGVELIRTLDDIVDGDHLTLTCGLFHKSTKLEADFMHRLPSEIKHAVRVRLISPLRNWNHDASGSSENYNFLNKQSPKIAAAPDKRIATDRSPIVGSGVSESKHSNEVIVMPGHTIAATRSLDTVLNQEMTNNNQYGNKGNTNNNNSAEEDKENHRPMHHSSNNHHRHPNNTHHHHQIRHSLPPNSSGIHHPLSVMGGGASSSGGGGSNGVMSIAPIFPPPPPPPPMGILSQQQHQHHPHQHHRSMLPPSSSSGSSGFGGVGCHPNMSIGISTGGMHHPLSVTGGGASSSGGGGSNGAMSIAPIFPPPPPPPPGNPTQQQHHPHQHHRSMLPSPSSSGSSGVGCHPYMSIGISTGGLLSVQSSGAMTGSTSNSITTKMNIRYLKISARLWIHKGAPVSGFVEMRVHIHMPRDLAFVIPRKVKTNWNGDNCDEDRDRGVFRGTRNQYAMCSLYVQIGKLLGVRPRKGKDSLFEEIYRHWSLSRNSFYREGLIRTLDDLVEGDYLVLNCGMLHKCSHMTKDFMKQLPPEYKDDVKVSLISPRRNRDHDASAGSSENINSSNKRPKVVAAPGKRIATDRRPIFGPNVYGPKHSNEVIEISSDDESETSSVEDVTDKWRAKRDEERSKMKENAEEID